MTPSLAGSSLQWKLWYTYHFALWSFCFRTISSLHLIFLSLEATVFFMCCFPDSLDFLSCNHLEPTELSQDDSLQSCHWTHRCSVHWGCYWNVTVCIWWCHGCMKSYIVASDLQQSSYRTVWITAFWRSTFTSQSGEMIPGIFRPLLYRCTYNVGHLWQVYENSLGYLSFLSTQGE